MSKQWQRLARWGTVVIGGIAAGNQLWYAANAWSEWHLWVVTDPSAADLYETNFWIGLTSAAAILGIAWFVFWLLRPNFATITSTSVERMARTDAMIRRQRLPEEE